MVRDNKEDGGGERNSNNGNNYEKDDDWGFITARAKSGPAYDIAVVAAKQVLVDFLERMGYDITTKKGKDELQDDLKYVNDLRAQSERTRLLRIKVYIGVAVTVLGSLLFSLIQAAQHLSWRSLLGLGPP